MTDNEALDPSTDRSGARCTGPEDGLALIYYLFQLDHAYIPVTVFQFDPPIFQGYSRNSSMRLLLRQPLTAHRIAKTAKHRQKSSQISRERKAQPCSRAFQAEWALSVMTPSPISKLMSKLLHQHLEYVKNMYVLAATRM